MKIKVLNALLIIDILTAILVASIFYFPSSVVNIILGIPILLFFPGYALLQALFVSNERRDSIELMALSIGMSIAVVALIGLGLNYTPWGISLEPALLGISSFIYLMSVIALIRRVILKRISLITEFNFELPSWEGSKLNKSFSVVLVVLILCAGGLLGYIISTNKTTETFTEFYILGLNGQAQNYPSELIMQGGQITKVRYGVGGYQVVNGWSEVTMGIFSHEKQQVTYYIKINVDDEPVNINYDGTIIDELALIELRPGEKWEGEIGFAPENLGDNQRVEFLLFKGDDTTPVNSLHLWVNVREPHTEFYLLGANGQAQDYPSEFVMQNDQITEVKYGTGTFQISEWGKVTVGIVSRETQKAIFSIKIMVDDKIVMMNYDGAIIEESEAIELQPNDKWEQEIGFAPEDPGNNQRVNFLLFKEGDVTPIDSLTLWINVY